MSDEKKTKVLSVSPSASMPSSTTPMRSSRSLSDDERLRKPTFMRSDSKGEMTSSSRIASGTAPLPTVSLKAGVCGFVRPSKACLFLSVGQGDTVKLHGRRVPGFLLQPHAVRSASQWGSSMAYAASRCGP